MDIVIGWVGIAVVAVTNVAVIAYSFGRLAQKVVGLDSRIERLEKAINGWVGSSDGHS